MNKQEIINKAKSFFDEGYNCSQAVLLAFSDQYQIDERSAKLISSTFGGGMGRLKETCGAVTGGFMVLGLEFGNETPDNSKKLDAYQKVRELNQQVIDCFGTNNCAELLKLRAKEVEENNQTKENNQYTCRNIVAKVTGMVYDMINTQANENTALNTSQIFNN